MEGIYSDEQWLTWVDMLAEKEYVVMDEFIPDHIYVQLKSYFMKKLGEDEFSKAAIGASNQSQIISEIRGDFTYWLDEKVDNELIDYWKLVNETMYILNRYCYLSLSGSEFHFAHYPKGAYYKKHLDQFANRNNRMISMVIYFNDNWKEGDGGELEIFKENQSLLIAPLAKRCVMFKSDSVLHAVRSANKPRNSLTGWLLYLPASLGPILS